MDKDEPGSLAYYLRLRARDQHSLDLILKDWKRDSKKESVIKKRPTPAPPYPTPGSLSWYIQLRTQKPRKDN